LCGGWDLHPHDMSSVLTPAHLYLGLARTINIRCIYGTFGREITKYTVIYGVYIRFWPTLPIPSVTYVHTHTHTLLTHSSTLTVALTLTVARTLTHNFLAHSSTLTVALTLRVALTLTLTIFSLTAARSQ